MKVCTIESIEIRRVIPAPRERVYAAWIRPELLVRWLAPEPLTATVDALDATVGGAYRVTMRGDGAEHHVVSGRYLDLDAPQRIRMTWAWEGEPEEPSEVTVDFFDRPGGTEVVVRHRQLTPESAAAHTDGWNACFNKLQRAVSAAA